MPGQPDGWTTLQGLADEIDDALARRDIGVETARKLYDVLSKLADGEADKPVEPEGAVFFRNLLQSLIKQPRLYQPEEEEGAA